MKNLELLELLHKPLNCCVTNEAIFSQTSIATYFINDNILYKHDFETEAVTELCPQSFENAILLKVLTIENKVCVVSENTIYILDVEGQKELQTLSFESNIAAASWNPTEEIVAIVYNNGNVVTYSIDYENGEIFPQGRSTVEAKIPDTVYVGWGSKDTQFRGSEGKLKNQTPVETKPIDERNPTISWRGNGEMFVINYWEESKRKFVVFATPCKALYRSEECPGLQAPVAWRPAGNMIATISEINNHQNVVIFEKNGQKRFNFELNFDIMVKTVKWSPCAQILTLHTHDSLTETHTLYLLTSSNYKWYTKQTLTFRSDNPLLDFHWLESTNFTYTLRVVTRSQVIKYTFRQIVSRSSGICCVIDGNSVNVTDFNDFVIPPIMSSKKVNNSSNINFVAYYKDHIVTCDCENNLKTFDSDGNVKASLNLFEMSDAGSVSSFPLAYHHFSIIGDELYLASETTVGNVVVLGINLETKKTSCKCDVTDPVGFLTVMPNANEDINGFEKICPNLDIYVGDTYQNTVYQNVAIVDSNIYSCRLMSNCHFYVNDNSVNDCVNSFVIFDKYLLYTTKLNQLHCVRFDGKSINDTYVRSIEQGAIIVTPISNSPKVVLQLPRGNLETISCRSISIDILDRFLNQNQWVEALTFVRLEKLNANLLFDLDPERFLGQIEQFIKGAKTINELNSVCLEFQNDNVLETLYKKGKVDSNSKKIDTYPKKTDAIFEAILKYFDSSDYADYITTIMIISLNFFTLRKALIYLQDLLRRSFDDVTLKQKLIDAVNTLKTYGCDQEKLYTKSLLLYDLDLAHFVATRCQLDPRIYEPHLNNLKNLPEIERRYEINIFAKKPKSAIAYLIRCTNTDSETLSSFIKTHGLGQVAYESCPPNNRHYPIVVRAFAYHLNKLNDHEGAAVVLKRAGLLKEALEELKLSMNWREVLNLLGELEVEEVERIKVVNDVAERLRQRNLVKEAAILYEFYAGSYEMAVKILLENYHFEEAIHIAKKYKRGDIMVSEVVPLLIKHKAYLMEKLTELSDKYDKYKMRLAQVRRTKVEKLADVSYEDDDRKDLFSDAGSTSTRSSRWTRMSGVSRSSRKLARKKQDLREGGVFEDIALIRALHCIIKEINTKANEVQTCCTLLLQESDMKYKEIKQLNDFSHKLHLNVIKGLHEIWPPHFVANHKTQDLQELSDLENFQHLDTEYRTPPSMSGFHTDFLFRHTICFGY